MLSNGIIKELILLDGKSTVRIQCDTTLIPSAGQYLLAYADSSNAPLAAPVFPAKSYPDGFLAAPPITAPWSLGMNLRLNGPLGHGFHVPGNAHRIALIAFDDSTARLSALLHQAIKQDAAIVLVCQTPPDDLPSQVEVQPLKAAVDIFTWAEYVAMDAARESLAGV